MINQALKILLKVNNWQTFLDELDNLGSDPKFKKIKGEAFEQLTKYFFLNVIRVFLNISLKIAYFPPFF